MNNINNTIYGSIIETNLKSPDKTAIICGNRTLSYSELLNRVNALTNQLLMAGISKGDRIGIAVSGKVDYLVTAIGGMVTGGVPVSLPHGKDIDISWALDDCDPKAVVYDSVHEKSIKVCLSKTKNFFLIDVKGDLIENKEIPKIAKIDLQDTAIIIYTSGTSSDLRTGVLISYENLKETVNYMNRFMQIGQDIVEYVVPPINHAFGFGRCRAVFNAGGTLVFDDGIFNPAKALVALEKNDSNAISSVSSGFSLLIDHYEKHVQSINQNIKWVEIGSSPLSVKYKNKLLEVFPNARIVMNYGLTEAIRSTMIELRSEITKLTTVGRPSPGIEIRITNDDGNLLSPGETGEISIKGANVAKSFWKKEEVWDRRYNSGWLKTGDLGYLDEDGYLTLSGRADDIINVGGKKFSPIEIEEHLRTKLSKSQYCICGIPDPKGVLGEVPVLCIEGSNTISIKDVQEFLRNLVEDYKIPKVIQFFEVLPKTHNGKIKRNEIKSKMSKGIAL